MATCERALRWGLAAGFWDPWATPGTEAASSRQPAATRLSGSGMVWRLDNHPSEHHAGSSQGGSPDERAGPPVLCLLLGETLSRGPAQLWPDSGPMGTARKEMRTVLSSSVYADLVHS